MFKLLNFWSNFKFCPITQREVAVKLSGQNNSPCQTGECASCPTRLICKEYGWWHCSACGGWHIDWTLPISGEKQKSKGSLMEPVKRGLAPADQPGTQNLKPTSIPCG